MLGYTLRRLAYMLVIIFVTSITAFVVINLPPGDWLASHIAHLQSTGQVLDEAEIATLTRTYGLDMPAHERYLKWIGGMLRGNFGMSFSYNRPVRDLLMERLPITVMISFMALVVTYMVAIPIGIYSATRQYSLGDYFFTVIGFIGIAVPNFLLALNVMYFSHRFFGLSIGGLHSPRYLGATEWTLDRFLDMLRHLPIPLVIIGLAGTASLIRVMRGCLLDELHKQYVITARTKGVSEMKLLFKYPVRLALNPVASTIGWVLPAIFSGETIVAIVLNLPTTGPLLYQALLSQDMYLAGSIVMVLTLLTVIGTFMSDILLLLLDPRIQLTK